MLKFSLGGIVQYHPWNGDGCKPKLAFNHCIQDVILHRKNYFENCPVAVEKDAEVDVVAVH